MVSGPEDGAATVTETDPLNPAQTRAAFAYARTLLEADVADAAAEDALSAFRQAVAARASAADGVQPPPGDETLLALTRLMTAVSVPDRSSPADRRQAVWASIGHTSHCTCRESAALLATRANGNIQPRESAALDDHLATCAECRELSVRAAEAEAAFRQELVPPKRPGGFGGLPSVPPTAYGALGVLIAIVIGAVLLLSGGSKSNPSHAALAPVQTQASAQLRVAATSHPAVRTHAKKIVRRTTVRKHIHKHRVTHQVATTTAPAITSATPAGNTGASSATASANTGTGNTGAATNQPATADPTTADPGTTASAGSTASQVSGSASLPADSAPQQGIGSPTTTTP